MYVGSGPLPVEKIRFPRDPWESHAKTCVYTRTLLSKETMPTNCAEAVNELRVVLTTPNVPWIKQTLAQVRPELSPDSATFRAAVLLLVGPAVEFNIDRLTVRTQVPRALVAACTRRLFDNGVWQPDGPVYTWTTPDDEAFWSDVAVAEGLLCRRTDRLGRIEWANAGSWRKAYDFVADDDETLTVAYVAEGDITGEAKRRAPVTSEDRKDAEVGALPVRKKTTPGDAVTVPALAGVGSDSNVWLGAQPSGLFPHAQWLR